MTERLDWSNGVPWSERFEDIYYSRSNGLAESRYVFLRGNRVAERWQKKGIFRISEAGFGTGLNFLATWQLWRETRAQDSWLHFESILVTNMAPKFKNICERIDFVICFRNLL